MNSTQVVLVTTLAQYQTSYWKAVGLLAAELGVTLAFLSFDDRSTEELRAAGLLTFDGRSRQPDRTRAQSIEVIESFGIRDLHKWVLHERLAFGVGDSDYLVAKLADCLQCADHALKVLSKQYAQITVVQEVGGFLSVVGVYFATRKHELEHWFIEPSFFKGGLLFSRNSFAAPKPEVGTHGLDCSPEMLSYLQSAKQAGTVVIPRKDAHHYSAALKKVLNQRNLTRLVQKVVDKYLLGKRQEFGHIGWHVQTHLRMVVNARKMRAMSTSMDQLGQFVYYPLHVPADMALTLRAPEYLDQLTLIERIAQSLPYGLQLVIKEHPAMIGAMDARRVGQLLKRYDHLKLVPAQTNNYEVLRRARAVVTVNSKSGAEAALLGVPVLALGDAFYSDAPFITPFERGADLSAAITRCLQAPRSQELDSDSLKWFEALWRQTRRGELYVDHDDSVKAMADALAAVLQT